jgi:hypothetical protein
MNQNANAKNASNSVPLFFRYTMNVSLVARITLGQVKLEPLDMARTQNFI